MEIKRVVILMGGSSSEREISIKSGTSVMRAIEKLGMEALPVTWDGSPEVSKEIIDLKPDAVFVALHGRGGEDGKIQSILELSGIPYTGPGPLGCAIAMNKVVTKKILTFHQIPTPPFFIWRKGDDYGDYQPFPMPWIVKPSSEGSTIGVTVVNKREELKDALEKAFELGDEVLIERFLKGREVTCGVVNGRILPPLEIVPKSGIYDFESKYISTETEYIVPAKLPENTLKNILRYTELAASFTYNKPLCRVDFIVHRDLPYVLEINSIPGLTEKSLLPKEASAHGMAFEKLILEILKGAKTGKA